MNGRQLDEAVEEVRVVMTGCLGGTALRSVAEQLSGVVGVGKMLRARLTFRVGAATGVSHEDLLKAAAAVELSHAASLLHDDVIDGGIMRRGAPSFWIQKGVSGAVLVGDLLVCEAFGLVSGIQTGRPVDTFVASLREMCEAEVEQELLLRGKAPDWNKCIDLARRKTGSLFAFAAYASGCSNEALSPVLREAGYSVGTAYQLADDLLDSCGDPDFAGKTLGNDAVSRKITAASSWRAGGVADPRVSVMEFCQSSLAGLSPWPAVAAAWREYLDVDLLPAIEALMVSVDVPSEMNTATGREACNAIP